MPPSRSELEAMADELGYVGEERAAFVGDITPTPKPKSVDAPKVAAQPTTTKAAPAATKPKEPAKVTAFVDEPWPEYGPPAPAPQPAARAPGVGPRVAAGMEPLPSPLMAKVAGVAGNVASKVYDARMALAGETPPLRDRVEDIAGFNRVMSNVESARAADVAARRAGEMERQAEIARTAASSAKARTAGTAPQSQPASVPAQTATPASKPAQAVTGGVTLQQAVDGLRTMGVPQALIDAELKKGEDGQRNVIDAYRNRTEK